jgi:hypothetical protein
MSNQNPIRTYYPAGYADYQLPAGVAGKTLYITAEVLLDPADSWKYSEMNEVSINGDPKFNTPTKPVARFKAGKISSLVGQPMSIRTRLLLAYVNEKASQAGLPETTYSVSFFADNDLIERHELKVTDDAPKFYTKLKLSLES